MATFEIKDKNGNIVKIKGLKGDKGDPIDVQVDGVSVVENGVANIPKPKNGVYIGDGEMPEDCVLRINPNGEISGIVEDVQVNGVSVTTNGIANLPIADYNNLGVLKPNINNGVMANGKGELYLGVGANSEIDARTTKTRVITPSNLDYAVKQAMCDGVGQAWTNEEKANARERMGINPWRLISKIEITEPIRTITIDKDINNNDLKLKKAMLYIKSIRSTDSTTNGNGRIFLNSMTPDTVFSGFSVAENTYYTNVYFELLDSGLPLGYGTTSVTSLGQNPNLKAVNINPAFPPQESINKLRIDTDKQTCLYGIGTTFEIWGVDK